MSSQLPSGGCGRTEENRSHSRGNIRPTPLSHPRNFAPRADADEGQKECQHSLGMGLGVGKTKGRSSGHADYGPGIDAKMLTKLFNVAD